MISTYKVNTKTGAVNTANGRMSTLGLYEMKFQACNPGCTDSVLSVLGAALPPPSPGWPIALGLAALAALVAASTLPYSQLAKLLGVGVGEAAGLGDAAGMDALNLGNDAAATDVAAGRIPLGLGPGESGASSSVRGKMAPAIALADTVPAMALADTVPEAALADMVPAMALADTMPNLQAAASASETTELSLCPVPGRPTPFPRTFGRQASMTGRTTSIKLPKICATPNSNWTKA